jgi:RNA polymerase-associated protein LEO1
MDSHTYLATAHEATQLLRTTGHITTSLTVLPNNQVNDEALNKLQESLKAAVRGNNRNPDGGIARITVNEDPELDKRRAELAEREKNRAKRRLELSEARERDRTHRAMGRVAGSGRLTAAGLEDDMITSSGAGRRRGLPGTKKRAPRRDDYSTDEDLPRGRTREDEYDKNDDFLVDDDEEEEIEEGGDDDDDDILDDGSEDEKMAKQTSPKRNTDDGTGGRGKRRKVIEDDEDE